MAVPTQSTLPQVCDPIVDFSSGSEEFGIANTDYQRSWASFRDVMLSEGAQLEPLFANVDQSQSVPIPLVRAAVRRINRTVAMSYAMAREVEKDRGELNTMKSRIEEAFVRLESVVIDVDRKNKSSLICIMHQNG